MGGTQCFSVEGRYSLHRLGGPVHIQAFTETGVAESSRRVCRSAESRALGNTGLHGLPPRHIAGEVWEVRLPIE